MARPRSEHVAIVKQKLIARLGDGMYHGGDRFFSIRGIANHFGVSYQTADRLLRELADEGHLERRQGSGTYVSGTPRRLSRVRLIFDRRARRAGSFGARLLTEISAHLRRAEISFGRSLIDPQQAVRIAPGDYPVLWEVPVAAADLMRARRTGLLLNDRPPPGLGALLIDSVAVDDALGGTCAAELIDQRVRHHATVAVLAGPANDPRTQYRVAGFMVKFPKARVVYAPTWFREDALKPAADLLAAGPDAVFACNDRLAQAVMEAAAAAGRAAPVLFGFDDAPVAERLHLSTIAVPWQNLAAAVAAVAGRRLSGEAHGASHQLLSPRPIIRLT